MNTTIDTQITLPVELYQLLAEQAKAHGNSISVEVTALLTPLLMQMPPELDEEIKAWEAASDKDWLAMEETLASKEKDKTDGSVKNTVAA
ncbi:No_hits_found [Rivularia sp. IAM M-261]|nr:No_hits_found [Rivularia sp. IAM M-261]